MQTKTFADKQITSADQNKDIQYNTTRTSNQNVQTKTFADSSKAQVMGHVQIRTRTSMDVRLWVRSIDTFVRLLELLLRCLFVCLFVCLLR